MSDTIIGDINNEDNILQLYLHGKKQYELLKSGKIHPREKGYLEFVDKVILIFKRVLELISLNSIFSSNEVIEDIPTSSLKYLLVPYYLAFAYSKINDLDKRLEALKNAKILYRNFIKNCINIEVLSDKDEEIFNREEDIKSLDPNVLRSEKIERLDKKKKLQEKLNKYEKIMQETNNDENLSHDEEHEREMTILLIQLCAQESFDEIGLIDKEIEMLEHRVKLQKGEFKPEDEPQVPAWKGIKTSQGYLKTFVIDKRKEIKDKVFKPHWNLPTISIEEAGEIEYRQMLEREKESERLKQEREKNKKDSDDEYSDEEKIKKEREWDDWKDDNPRGWGNTGSKGYVKY